MIIPGVIGRIVGDRESPPATGFTETVVEHLGDTGDFKPFNTAGCIAGAVAGGTLQEGDISCALSGNIDWLSCELADVQMKRGPEAALCLAYRRHGADFLDLIGGRFSVVVWDADARKGLVACDRFGQIPLFWLRADDGSVCFAPTADAVMAIAGVRPELSDQGIFNYLYFHMVPGPQSVYGGVNKLMAAHVLEIDDYGCRTRRYWVPEFRESADRSMSDATEEMLGLLSSSVNRLAVGADTGAFLSGGLDSSTVAGLLARHQPHPKTYSIGFDAEGYDEIAYARIASERFGTDFQTYYVTPDDVVGALPKIAAAYDEPFGNSSALPAYFCAYVAASDGRQRLLAGDGGDELFAGNERYAKQTVFENYQLVPSWLRKGLFEPLLFNLAPESIGLFRKARSYVEQANIGLPDRLRTYNFLNRLGLETIMQPDFLGAVDPTYPSDLAKSTYWQLENVSQLNRLLFLDWQHTLTDNDLRKVNRMCQLAGIEVEYPMLDHRLVEFSTRVSSGRKMRGNRLRYFYKRAVAEFLPAEIINKSKHGFGLPFGVWMRDHPPLQELAQDNLARMRRRKYVRSAFIDEISMLHRDHNAGYYGEMIWILVMLELWLTAKGIEP